MSDSALHRGVVSVLVSQLFIPPPNSAYAFGQPFTQAPKCVGVCICAEFPLPCPSFTSVRVMKSQECCVRGDDAYFGRGVSSVEVKRCSFD
jgi:hypothetical protein